MLTLEELCARVRANCKGCDGTGIMGAETAPDGESYQAIECQYCGELIRAIRAAVTAAVAAEREACAAIAEKYVVVRGRRHVQSIVKQVTDAIVRDIRSRASGGDGGAREDGE